VRLRLTTVLCALAAASGATGCIRDEGPQLAPACREGSASVMTALRDAPGPVTLDGAPLSHCLRDAREGGDLSEVGVGFLDAAATLAPRAVRDPEGPEAVRLGYLVGAARRGVPEPQGPGSELVRRLESEARQVGPRSRALRRGEREGRRSG
jgi:hypothetical protein